MLYCVSFNNDGGFIAVEASNVEEVRSIIIERLLISEDANFRVFEDADAFSKMGGEVPPMRDGNGTLLFIRSHPAPVE